MLLIVGWKNEKSKYVIIKSGSFELPYIFCDLVNHNDFARNIGGVPVSAGFCFITKDGRYEAYGKSVSLNLKSRDEDSGILNKFLIGE